MNAWLPRASYPCWTLLTLCIKLVKSKMIDRPAFAVRLFILKIKIKRACPFALRAVCPAELALGHLRTFDRLSPPQPTKPPESCTRSGSRRYKEAARLGLEGDPYTGRFRLPSK
ncbi:hypothetical protein JTE90_011991 [Oedothorax gibbosus]|uniref:Secreted protein n=1 Tax=Oedothorax gibbosus TaxID=931172 RepID=A0AAV6TGB9_9ARAC|nr:hypothetical protein JTE90_011991 [Oedothorax gibbosus]